jgi:hypothetical protein
MATHDAYLAPADLESDATTDRPSETRVGVRERWRQHRAERQRREVVQWLRGTAKRAHDTDPIRRRREALLHYRAAAVRTDLLEIATILEHTQTPDPTCVTMLRRLLADGCDSPLYNCRIPVSELRAALDDVRRMLRRPDAGVGEPAV